jgi:predicted enzyme related to lactoylglutathione lyase
MSSIDGSSQVPTNGFLITSQGAAYQILGKDVPQDEMLVLLHTKDVSGQVITGCWTRSEVVGYKSQLDDLKRYQVLHDGTQLGSVPIEPAPAKTLDQTGVILFYHVGVANMTRSKAEQAMGQVIADNKFHTQSTSSGVLVQDPQTGSEVELAFFSQQFFPDASTDNGVRVESQVF